MNLYTYWLMEKAAEEEKSFYKEHKPEIWGGTAAASVPGTYVARRLGRIGRRENVRNARTSKVSLVGGFNPENGRLEMQKTVVKGKPGGKASREALETIALNPKNVWAGIKKVWRGK